HHIGGDQNDDFVEAVLRADRLRHHFAKPPQKHARTAERATHWLVPQEPWFLIAVAPRRSQAKCWAGRPSLRAKAVPAKAVKRPRKRFNPLCSAVLAALNAGRVRRVGELWKFCPGLGRCP